MDVSVNDLLADEKLQALFKQLNISEENQKKLCCAFYEHITAAPSTEMNLEKMKDCLLVLVATPIDDSKFQQVIKEIGDYLHQHSIIFYSTIKRVKELEEKTKLISEEMMQMKEQQDINNALIISNEISSLYIEYIVKPILLQVFGDSSWDKFCTKLAALESELDNSRIRAIEAGTPIDDVKLYKPIVKFLEPI
jgi:hypothetical protein